MSSRTRLNIFIEPDHAKRLEKHAAHKGVSKSAAIAAALASFLSLDAADQREAAVGKRLDHLSRQFDRLERDLNILIETVSHRALARRPDDRDEKTTVSSGLRLTAIGNDVTLPSGTTSPQHKTTAPASTPHSALSHTSTRRYRHRCAHGCRASPLAPVKSGVHRPRRRARATLGSHRD